MLMQGRLAVIYCRVSDPKQVKEGHGLSSQETRCREYAKHKGYEVIEAYHEEGITGALLDRPQMQNMLRLLRQHKKEQYIVIIDDISRLARDLKTHLRLRTTISNAGGKLESPSIEFGEDSDSRLVEHLLASVAAHQREKNAEQVTNRMRARVQNGFYLFAPPIGYKYENVSGHGKMLVRKEPVASILQEALESFALGRFETVSEVKRFLDSHADIPKGRSGEFHFQRVDDLLRRALYAGYIDVPEWGISLQPGKHEPLISFETFQMIQRRLDGQARLPTRKDINDDFPLRGFVTCADCEQPMTSCWSKGRSGKYPYYLCRTKGCISSNKSIRKEKLEAEFENLLLELRPSRELFYLSTAMFQEWWEAKIKGRAQEAVFIKSEIRKLEHKVEQFLERVIQADSPTLINTYETQIRKLEEQKAGMSEKIKNCGRPLQSFDDTYRTAITFLANPYKLWASDCLEHKRTVLKLVFAEKLPYDRKSGYRTAAKSLPFALLEGLRHSNYEMVEQYSNVYHSSLYYADNWLNTA